MEIIRTNEFQESIEKLDASAQQKIKNCILLMSDDLAHPSLRMKKMKEYRNPDVWEATASQGSPALRITYERKPGILILRNCGEHDTVYLRP